MDTVAAAVGEELRVDDWKIDVALCGSQKAISAPPGLSIVSISEDAFRTMESRKTPIASFYCNLLIWKNYYEEKWFPYTMPISDIIGLRQAVDNIFEEGKDKIIERHKNIAEAIRIAIREAGLELYIKEGYANTVTVFEVPEQIISEELLEYMKKNYNLLISGSFGYLKGKVIRIGHMGENARVEKMLFILKVLQSSLEILGYQCKADMAEVFFDNMNVMV